MSHVELVEVMGSDLTVVNAARVSYDKRVDTMRESDIKLLHYLADHKHWSPFSHPQISFRITANIAVARQLYRHTVGLAVNEVSRRYVNTPPEFDLPDVWRAAPVAGQSKQGSGGAIEKQALALFLAQECLEECEKTYSTLLRIGVAPEQARLVLPMAMTTSWIWTGSLMAFIRICLERLAPEAQAETREVAQEFRKYLLEYFPHSMDAWVMGV